MKKNTGIIITKAVMAVLCLAMLVLSCIFLRELPKVILLVTIIIFASLGVIVPGINAVKHETIYKLFIVSTITCAIVLISFIILDKTGLLTKFQDLDSLTEIIRGTKQWGILVFILLVIFQVIFLPIPGPVPALIGNALYGPTYSFLFMTVGTISGSIIAFALGKIFGKKLVSWMIGADKTDKYASILNDKGRFLFIVMMLFPFFPDDILCLVAGITAMSYKYFITVICITRPPMIAFYCYFGSGQIIPFSGWGIPVWIALFAVALFLIILATRLKNYVLNKKNKPKPVKTEDALPQSTVAEEAAQTKTVSASTEISKDLQGAKKSR